MEREHVVALRLRNNERMSALKSPLQGICILVLSSVLFIIWLGALVAITKALMG